MFVVSNFINIENNSYKSNNRIVDYSKHNKTKISFQAYLGADWYGTKEDKEALNYKIKLTPEKIAQNIQNANSLGDGIVISKKEFSEDGNNFYKALDSFQNIRKQYSDIVKNRLKEIYGKNPKLSKVPYVGLAAQDIQLISGSFMEGVEKDLIDLGEDYVLVRDKCLVCLDQMFCSHIDSGNALKEAVKGFIDYAGTTEKKVALYNAIVDHQNKNIAMYKTLRPSLDNFGSKLVEGLTNIYNQQIDKQKFRTIKKTATIIIGGL